MAVQVEIWEKDIIEGLYAANPHLALAVNADQYVLAGKVVHIPQAGAAPKVTKNRNQYPATVVRRTDTDVTYTLDEYTSEPVHIPDADTAELSYDKRASVLAGTRNSLNDSVGVNMLYNWFPEGGMIIATSGKGYADIVPAHLDGATGLRRALKLADLKKLQLEFNKKNIPTEGRHVMIDAVMYDQFTNEMSANQQRDFLAAYNETTGVMGKIFGFNIMTRSTVMTFKSGGKVIPGTEGEATHCAGALAWQKDMVERALGDVKFFENLGDPQYYGDIYSALVRMSGRSRRADKAGIAAIVQSEVTPVAWAATTGFNEGAIVKSDNKAYFCLVAHQSQAAFTSDAEKWREIVTA